MARLIALPPNTPASAARRRFYVDFTACGIIEVAEVWTDQMVANNPEAFDAAILAAIPKALENHEIEFMIEDVFIDHIEGEEIGDA